MNAHRRRMGVALALSILGLAACGGSTAHRAAPEVEHALATSTPAATSAPTGAPLPTSTATPTAAPSVAATPAPRPTPAPTPRPTPVPARPPSPDSLPGHTVTTTLDGHTVIVYVPGAYTALPASRFPVVYFLHGSPGTAESWITGGDMPAILDSLIANGQLTPIIAVFPDDQGVIPDDSYWGNTPLGDTVETWFVTTLIPTIDSTYRTLGTRYRGIAGLSAGGFGAVNLSIRNPGVFSWVASYSGVFTAPENLFGSESAANSPQLTISSVPASRRVPLFLGQGAQDTEFGPQTTQFVATVEGLDWAANAPLNTEVVPGPHSWTAWTAETLSSLAWLNLLWGRVS